MLLGVLGRLHITVFPTFHFYLKKTLALNNLNAMPEMSEEEWSKKSYPLKNYLNLTQIAVAECFTG